MSSNEQLDNPSSELTLSAPNYHGRFEDENDKPKRNLSAYNLFFQYERAIILREMPGKLGKRKSRRSHGKIGFASLARTIAARWKTIDPNKRNQFEKLAAEDKARYQRELKLWKKSKMCKEDEDQLGWKSPKTVVTNAKSHDVLPMQATSLIQCLQESNSVHLESEEKQESLAPEETDPGRMTQDFASIMMGISKLARILDDDCIAFLIGY